MSMEVHRTTQSSLVGKDQYESQKVKDKNEQSFYSWPVFGAFNKQHEKQVTPCFSIIKSHETLDQIVFSVHLSSKSSTCLIYLYPIRSFQAFPQSSLKISTHLIRNTSSYMPYMAQKGGKPGKALRLYLHVSLRNGEIHGLKDGWRIRSRSIKNHRLIRRSSLSYFTV